MCFKTISSLWPSPLGLGTQCLPLGGRQYITWIDKTWTGFFSHCCSWPQAPYVENRRQSWIPWPIGSFTHSTDFLSSDYVLGTACTLGIQAMRRGSKILPGSTEEGPWHLPNSGLLSVAQSSAIGLYEPGLLPPMEPAVDTFLKFNSWFEYELGDLLLHSVGCYEHTWLRLSNSKISLTEAHARLRPMGKRELVSFSTVEVMYI